MLLLFCNGCSGFSPGEEKTGSSMAEEKNESTEQSEPESGSMKPEEFAQENTIVRVESGSLTGSGVIYEKREDFLLVITAAHVLEQETEKVTVTFFEEVSVESAACYISSDADLAFLKIPLAWIPKEKWDIYNSVRIDKTAFDSLKSGDEVVFGDSLQTGFFEKGTVLENWTYVEDFSQYMMLIQGNIQPGMSGGGVYDKTGNFLGILCGGNGKGDVAVVPLSIIQAKYAELDWS